MKLLNTTVSVGLALMTLGQAAYAEPTQEQRNERNPVWDVATKQPVRRASSRLRRSVDKICLSADTRDLAPGAYTVWWVLYNEPHQCNNPVPYGSAACGDLDIANPAVRATVMWAQGKLVGPDGKAHLSACIKKGELTREVFDMGTREGLTNPLGAEVQLVIHSHDAARYDDARLLGEQLTKFVGGCTDTGGATAPECRDAQQIVHEAPEQ